MKEERDVEEEECDQVKGGRDGLDSADKKQEAQKEDSPDLRQGGWVQSDPGGGESDDKVEDVMKRILKDEDACVTAQGRVLRRNEKLESCGVTDGCTIQVTSSMRGGGRHKDKRRKSEKKQTTKPERQEQKCDEGPDMVHMDEAMRRLQENEEYLKNIDCMSEGSEGEVQQKVQNYLACIQKVSWMNKEQFEHLESGVWQAVEARRKGRDEEQDQRRRGKLKGTGIRQNKSEAWHRSKASAFR